MKASSKGVELIASFEGFVDHPYRDSGGVWTIGFGHTGPGVLTMGTISRAKGLSLLALDVAGAELAVSGLGLALTQGQFDALVSIVFNCGPGLLAPSRSLGAALRKDGMTGVPAAMALYTRDARGAVLAGLVRRRAAEAALFGSLSAAHGPAAWLTPVELRRCRELDDLAAAPARDAQQEHRRAILVRNLTEQRKRIWQAAQAAPKGDGHGWDYRNRRQRYHSLLARTA